MLERPAPISRCALPIVRDPEVTEKRAVAGSVEENRSGSPRFIADRRSWLSRRSEPRGGGGDGGFGVGVGVGSGWPFGRPPSGGGTLGPSANGGAWVTVSVRCVV